MQLNLQQKTENFAQRIFLLPFSWEIKFGVYLIPPPGRIKDMVINLAFKFVSAKYKKWPLRKALVLKRIALFCSTRKV